MNELLEYIGSDVEDDTFVRVRSLHDNDDGLILEIDVLYPHGTGTTSRWRIEAIDVRDYVLHPSGGSLIYHDRSHVLAREQSEPVVSLYFAAAPESAAVVIEQLVAAHAKATSGLIPMSRYLPGREQVQAGYGKLAEGPQFLIEAYREVLEANGMRPSSPPASPASIWNANESTWKPIDLDFNVLIIGASSFVGRTFHAHRV